MAEAEYAANGFKLLAKVELPVGDIN